MILTQLSLLHLLHPLFIISSGPISALFLTFLLPFILGFSSCLDMPPPTQVNNNIQGTKYKLDFFHLKWNSPEENCDAAGIVKKNYYTQYLPQKYGMICENLYLNTPQEARMSSSILFPSYAPHTCCLPTCQIHVVKMLLIPCQASRGAVFCVVQKHMHADTSCLAQCVLLSIVSNVWKRGRLCRRTCFQRHFQRLKSPFPIKQPAVKEASCFHLRPPPSSGLPGILL